MAFPKEQTDGLKKYCRSLRAVEEGGVIFLYLEGLRLPDGCDPIECNGLLCPVERDGYPSRLYFSAKVVCARSHNWNVSDARIVEENWFAFSWRVDPTPGTLAKMLVAHLAGFTKRT